MFTSGYNSNLLLVLVIITGLAALGVALILIIRLNHEIEDGEIMLLMTIASMLGIAAFALMGVYNNGKTRNIKDAITSAYPNAVISSDSKSFTQKGNSYTYRLDGEDIIVTDCDNNISTIREGQIVSTVNSAETTTEDAANADTSTNTGTSDNVKLQILQAYSENITDIVYTEGNSSGYFKMNDEYFRFTVESNNIVIRNDTDKIVNIISMNK